MAIITMPTDLSVGDCTFGQVRYDLVEQSDSSGSIAARVLGPPRWRMALRSQPIMDFAQAGKWEAMLYGLRGRVNHLAAFDPGRPAPAGTMRGSMRLARKASAGETSIVIVGGTAGTLLSGDPLQIGTGLGTSQYIKLMADGVSNPSTDTAFSWDNAGAFSWTNGGAFSWSDPGTIVVAFEAPLRRDFEADTVVTWDRPIAYYKLVSDTIQGSYMPGYVGQGGYALDLLEAFS